MRANLNQVASGLIVWNQPKSKMNPRSNLPDLGMSCSGEAADAGIELGSHRLRSFFRVVSVDPQIDSAKLETLRLVTTYRNRIVPTI
jgi:hypothetical protein